MTPEQRERLEYLKSKPLVRREAVESPIHMKHAHYHGFGAEPCACPPGCIWCPLPIHSPAGRRGGDPS